MAGLGYIDDRGIYHHGETKPLSHDVNSQFRSWSHDNQRKRFGRDIIQPYVGNNPNPEFIRSYPEEAKRYFSLDQIKQAERNLGGMA